MKVVLVNHSDSRGGASVVSMRLLEALRREGVVASMVVAHKSGSAPEVILTEGVRKHFLREHAEIFLRNGLSRKDLFKASIATSGLELHKIPEVAEADIVVLNWINQGMMSLKEIALLAAMGKKIVWTMHDMWNMTGICHHAGDCRRYIGECGYCPLLHLPEHYRDLSHILWERKNRLYDSVPVTFVAVSHWLHDRAMQSKLIKRRDVRVIHNAFPVEKFSPEPKFPRRELGLPERKKLIVMGAARLDDSIKGLPYAIEALNTLSEERGDFAAVFFGALRDKSFMNRLKAPAVWLGSLGDFDVIRSVYAHSAVVLSSSLFETLPGTLIEGMASGCFPVAFDSGGQSDIITQNGRNGFLATPYKTAELARGLSLGLDSTVPATDLRAEVGARFSARAIARQYISLFEEIL